MKPHKIGWLNVPGFIPQTWNPIIGCSKVSEGCRNCYAERMAYRLACIQSAPREYLEVLDTEFDLKPETRFHSFFWNGRTSLVESALQKPLSWKKPRAIFVNSMGDLFHENTPDEWIDLVFAVMALCPQHLFIVLTKRAERMEKYFFDGIRRNIPVYTWATELIHGDFLKMPGDMASTRSSGGTWWPLPNVWLGVTAENQEAADERIPHLLRTPAAVRFVSCEPLIGPVEISPYVLGKNCGWREGGIGWIICGGESGPGARPMNPEWARSLRDQAQSAGVPFFFKQWGYGAHGLSMYSDAWFNYAAGKNGGDMLDGRQWRQWPEVTK